MNFYDYVEMCVGIVIFFRYANSFHHPLCGNCIVAMLCMKRGEGQLVRLIKSNIPTDRKNSFFINLGLFDGKNLNRVFPGNPNGTEMERLAWAITKEVYPKVAP